LEGGSERHHRHTRNKKWARAGANSSPPSLNLTLSLPLPWRGGTNTRHPCWHFVRRAQRERRGEQDASVFVSSGVCMRHAR
jgi:hypothetical protein